MTATATVALALTGHAFVAVFPLTEDGLDMRKTELVAEAGEQIPDLLHETRAVLDGPLAWEIEQAEDDDFYLAARAPARPWTDCGRYREHDEPPRDRRDHPTPQTHPAHQGATP